MSVKLIAWADEATLVASLLLIAKGEEECAMRDCPLKATDSIVTENWGDMTKCIVPSCAEHFKVFLAMLEARGDHYYTEITNAGAYVKGEGN